MKNYILIILLLSLYSHLSLAQIAVNDIKQLRNVAQYREGEETLYRHFSRLTRIPKEIMSNPDVCTMLGYIKVNKSGEIEEIGSLNKVPDPIINQFIEVAKLTDGKWMPMNEAAEFSYLVLPIQFKFRGANFDVDASSVPKYFKESLVVVGFLPANRFINYKEDSKYLKKVEDFIADGKNDKAIETMEYLLSRQPFNSGYYKKVIDLYEKAGKKEKVEYYTTLMAVLSDKS